jgi:hypothetical protein
MAARSRSTWIVGRGFTPPASMRRMYCGRRKNADALEGLPRKGLQRLRRHRRFVTCRIAPFSGP